MDQTEIPGTRRERGRRCGNTRGGRHGARPRRRPGGSRAQPAGGRSRRGLLARDPGGVHRRPQHRQHEQRHDAAEPPRRAGRDAPALRILGERRHSHHRLLLARSRTRPPSPGQAHGLRARGAGADEGRERGRPDRDHGPRPEAGRRDSHDRLRLPAVPHLVAPARVARGCRPAEDRAAAAARAASISSTRASSRRSRRRRACSSCA